MKTNKSKLIFIGIFSFVILILLVSITVNKYYYNFHPWNYLLHRQDFATISIDPNNSCTYNSTNGLVSESTVSLGTPKIVHVLKSKEKSFIASEMKDGVCFFSE